MDMTDITKQVLKDENDNLWATIRNLSKKRDDYTKEINSLKQGDKAFRTLRNLRDLFVQLRDMYKEPSPCLYGGQESNESKFSQYQQFIDLIDVGMGFEEGGENDR